MLLRGPYFPSHEENRMAHEGDVVHARNHFFEKRPPNLVHLLRERYGWMNEYTDSKEVIYEFGSGAGLAKEFITNPNLRLTDVEKYPWIDEQVDALHIDIPDDSVDALICSHMIHHLAKPLAFLESTRRILKKGGVLLIHDLQMSFLARAIFRVMRHEGWSLEVDVFDRNTICNDAADLWSANCAIPQLLFQDMRLFQQELPGFRVLKNELCECLTFLLSGGVTSKTFTIPLPQVALKLLSKVDKTLIRLMPSLFPLSRMVALQKR